MDSAQSQNTDPQACAQQVRDLEDRAASLRRQVRELQIHKELYQKLFEESVSCNVLLDAEATIVDINTRFCHALGYCKEEVVGRSALDYLDEPMHQTVREHISQSMAGKETPSLQFVVRGRHGCRTLWLPQGYVHVWEADGRLLLLANGADITQRLLAEENLHHALQRLQEMESIVSQSPLIVVRWTDEPGWPVEYVNENIECYGYDAHDLITRRAPWLDFMHPEDLPQVQAAMRQAVERREMHYSAEYRITTRDGQVRWVEERSTIHPADSGHTAHIDGILWDVTRPKEAEQAAQHVNHQLLAVRDQERRRLAGELHDSVGQILVSMEVELLNLLSDRDACDGKESLELLIERCKLAVREIREICHGLHPPTLESLGLAAALRQLASDCRKHMEVRADLGAGISHMNLPADMGMGLYRIAQEAVSNALKHSHAQRLTLSLQLEAGNVVLSVEDDGGGIRPDCCEGIGMQSMRQRAEILGAALSVTTRPGLTRIEVRAPLDAE